MRVWRRCLGRPGGGGNPRVAGSQRGREPWRSAMPRYWTPVEESERLHSWPRFATSRPHGNGRELWMAQGFPCVGWRLPSGPDDGKGRDREGAETPHLHGHGMEPEAGIGELVEVAEVLDDEDAGAEEDG